MTAAGASLAQDVAEQHGSQNPCEDCEAETMGETDLSIWSGCTPEARMLPSQRLCNAAGGPIEGSTYRSIGNILAARVSDTKTLCSLEAAIVWSYNNCAKENPEVSLMGESVRLLAYNWAHLGQLERADLLYARAYVLVSSESGVLGKMAVLKDWTHVKLQLGDAREARRLVRIHTALAREYEASQSSGLPPQLLINSLLFEARILEQTGLADEARSAREEAEGLKSN